MIESPVPRKQTNFTPFATISFSTLLGVLIAAASFLVWAHQFPARGQTPKAAPNVPPTKTGGIEETRALIRDLEAQVKSQREQIEKTEAGLKHARDLLSALERDQPAPHSASDKSLYKHAFNPNDPMQGETFSRQALAEKTPWSWPTETATPEACVRQFRGGGFEVEIKAPGRPSELPMIEVRKKGKTIVSWRAHIASVFLRAGEMLYFADFSPYATGCSIVAYHLGHGEQWKTPLWGIGPLGHSMYSNRVNMKLDGNNLIIYGDESAGRYIELLDIRTGRIVGRRKGAGLKPPR